MFLEQKILSDITVFMKYSKYNPYLERRETWEEICLRNMEMHIKKFPYLKERLENIYQNFIVNKKILPAMRSLQFAGKPIELNNSRLFNCSYAPIDHITCFSEAMFLLLSGCGFGFSVQKHHVEQLPEIHKPTKSRRYLIGDSIEGWSDAIKVLIKSYYGLCSKPDFDFRDIRQKGALLITSGGKAPGPEPLKRCLFEIEQIFESKSNGEKLRPIDCHSIVCHIADAVLSGGIRRSATISLFSFDDEEMLSCKSGNWWEINPHFARANNSVVVLLNRIKKKEFFNIWEKIKASGAGEPGIYFTNDPNYGTNPCVETSLRPFTFCNLVEINGANIESQADFNERCEAAAFINTLQASYTDFHYLREIWKINTEKDALIGVGITGIASSAMNAINKEEGATIVKQVNEQIAKEIGINPAARCCVIKPAGTSSLVLGCSSGIHGYHNDFYIRRLRVGKNESIYEYLLKNHSELVEDEFFKPQTTAIITIPQKAPYGSKLRSESALELLERTKDYNINWVRASHRTGPNYHNVSATISIKDNEWDEVGSWMWDNRKIYHGLSILPYSEHNYKQAPFEDITEKEFNKMIKSLHDINLKKVVEINDNTDLKMEASCGGNGCDVI